MNLIDAKELNRGALLRLLGLLCAMVGFVAGRTVTTLPRHLRLSALRRLRPLESAVRRLLVMSAQDVSVDLPPARSSAQLRKATARQAGKGAPSFSMLDPQPALTAPVRKYAAGPGPRIFFFDGFDVPPEPPAPEPSPDDAMEARALCRRLLALQAVLADVPKSAARMARWQARKRRVFETKGRLAAGRMRPLRAGTPPGHRARGRYEIDAVLAECHIWALRTLDAPDTS